MSITSTIIVVETKDGSPSAHHVSQYDNPADFVAAVRADHPRSDDAQGITDASDAVEYLDEAHAQRTELLTVSYLRARSIDPQNADGADATHTARWTDSAGQEWGLPCYLLAYGRQVVMWSCTDEAGIDDITVALAEQDMFAQIREYADDLAAQLDEAPPTDPMPEALRAVQEALQGTIATAHESHQGHIVISLYGSQADLSADGSSRSSVDVWARLTAAGLRPRDDGDSGPIHDPSTGSDYEHVYIVYPR